MTAVTLRLPEPPIVTVGRPVARVSVGPLIQIGGGTGGGTGEPPALRAAYREASATGTVATTDGLVISTTAVTQHLPAVADMLDTGETYREVLFQAGGGAITVDVPSADTLYGLDGALLSSVLIPVGQSARFGTFTSGSPDSWVLLSHSGRMADLYNVGLGIACADYTTFVNDYSALVATTLVGGAVGVPILVLYDDDTLDRFVTTGSSCASRMTLTASAHSGQTVGAAVLLALPAFTTTLRWERMIGTDDGGSTYTVGVASVGALTDITAIPAHAMQIQFSAPLSAGLLGPLAPDGDGERAELLATTYQGKTIQQTEVFFNTGDPNDTTNGPWQITGTVEVGAICRRPTAIGSVPWDNITADLIVKAANARETRALGVIRIGPPYTKQATDVMYERAAGFPDNVESADGSIVPTATQGDVGLGHLDLVVDPANVTAGGMVEGPLDALDLNDGAMQAYLVGKLLAGHAIDISVDEDDKIVIAVDPTEIEMSDIDGLVAAMAAKQDVDSDITALAALTTTTFGRSLLELADAAALQSTVGGYVTLADTTLGSANAALTASWIGDYSDLRISVIGRTNSTGVATATVTCQFNSDTGSNYYNSGGSAGTSITLGVLSGSQTNTNRVGRIDAEIANQLAHHPLLGRYNAPSSSANSFSTGTTSGKWANTARINSIQLAMGAVNFDAGCRLIVEGRA